MKELMNVIRPSTDKMTMRVWIFSLISMLLILLSINVVKAADEITYYHNDISGTPILSTNAAGEVLWKESYRPYGDKLTKQAASKSNQIGFHGKPFDDDTGLSYMQARYYDPILGRFTGIDPVGYQEDNLHSFNRYAYANNNPYKYVDPDGNIPVETVWDAGNVIYDLGKIGVGKVTGNAALVRSGVFDLVGDSAALAIPYVPAGSTKIISKSNYVYRGLAKGEDPAKGLAARAPGAGNSEISHVAGKKQTQWISTTKDKSIAENKYGQNGVVRIDLNKVSSNISDISKGLPNGGRMSNWAKKDQEVLIKDHIPAEAIKRIR